MVPQKTPPAKIRRRFLGVRWEREVEIRDPLSWVSSSPEVATVTVDPENCNHATITATMEGERSLWCRKDGRIPMGKCTHRIEADWPYTIADVLVDGVSVGPVERYTFTNNEPGYTSAPFTHGLPWRPSRCGS